MGAVYKAADPILRRFVAVKLLHPTVVKNTSAVERFQREARAAAAIGHPNIIDVIDFGTEGEAPFMVMEYLRGRSLAQAIARDGQFAIARACAITTHALAGLAGAHARQIVHRDVKPANLMLIARFGDLDFVKICDFGFAALLRAERTDGRSLTPERVLVGTPAYAAPERMRSNDPRDSRADIYSMGVVLYEMLANRRPFDGIALAEIAKQVLHEEPPPLSVYRADVPKKLEEEIRRALARDPDKRFQSAAEFAEALVPFGGRHVPPTDIRETSDTFTMDLVKIRARDLIRRTTKKMDGPLGGSPSRRPIPIAIRPSPKPGVSAPPAVPGSMRPPMPARLDPPAVASLGQTEIERPSRRPPAPQPSRPPPAESPSPLAVGPLPRSPGDRLISEAVPLVNPPARRTAQTPGEVAQMRRVPVAKRSSVAPERPAQAPTDSGAATARDAVKNVDLPATNDAAHIAADDAATRHRISSPEASRSVRPVAPDASMSASRGTRSVAGAVVVAVLDFVTERFGARHLATVLDALAPGVADPFRHGVTPGSFVPAASVRALVEAIDANLGKNDLHLVVDCGREIATRFGAAVPHDAPSSVIAALPGLAGIHLRPIECTIVESGQGHGRFELDKHGTNPLVLCVGVLGFTEKALLSAGAVDVEVNLISCRGLGDARCLFEATWIDPRQSKT